MYQDQEREKQAEQQRVERSRAAGKYYGDAHPVNECNASCDHPQAEQTGRLDPPTDTLRGRMFAKRRELSRQMRKIDEDLNMLEQTPAIELFERLLLTYV